MTYAGHTRAYLPSKHVKHARIAITPASDRLNVNSCHTRRLRNKPPSTAMSERCEQAKLAFEGCLKTSTLPAAKRPQVEEELQACKNALMQITGCGQS